MNLWNWRGCCLLLWCSLNETEKQCSHSHNLKFCNWYDVFLWETSPLVMVYFQTKKSWLQIFIVLNFLKSGIWEQLSWVVLVQSLSSCCLYCWLGLQLPQSSTGAEGSTSEFTQGCWQIWFPYRLLNQESQFLSIPCRRLHRAVRVLKMRLLASARVNDPRGEGARVYPVPKMGATVLMI